MLFDTLSRDFLKAEVVSPSIKFIKALGFGVFLFSFFSFSLSECVGGSNKYLSRQISKAKSNDKDFLHDNNNKAD